MVTESNFASDVVLTPEDLREARDQHKILCSVPGRCDKNRDLWFEFAGAKGKMELSEVAYGPDQKPKNSIFRVGHHTCFRVLSEEQDEFGNPIFILSRKCVQAQYYEDNLSDLIVGDIIECEVSAVNPQEAFCDIGMGILSLLPISRMSVSRIMSAVDRVYVGERIKCVIAGRDVFNRPILSMKECLGTWEENVQDFWVGDTVAGFVRSVEPYGIFVEIAPNLCGLCDTIPDVESGMEVSVYVKSISAQKMKVKLSITSIIAHDREYRPKPKELKFYIPSEIRAGHPHMDAWTYSPDDCEKTIQTDFSTNYTFRHD